jgi:hypothetical protein
MPILKLEPQWVLGGEELTEVKTFKLPGGELGNIATVQFLVKLARKRAKHPVVRQLALTILRHARTRSMYYLDEARAIGEFVRDKMAYVKDIANVETVHDPLTMIDKISRGTLAADCDDHAVLLASLLLSIGHRPIFRIVRYRKDNPSYNHIYVVEYTKNKGDIMNERLVIDAIMKTKPIGFEVPHIDGRDFPV